jgi:hypothetical protein
MDQQEFIEKYVLAAPKKDKDEALRKAREIVGDEKQWNAIQLVYTYHPAITNERGKTQIANLIYEMGIGVIYAMRKEASEACERERKAYELRFKQQMIREELREIEKQIEELKGKDEEIARDWKI